MIKELTEKNRIVPDGTWRLVSVDGRNTISNQHRLEPGPKSKVWTGDNEQELKDFAATLPAVESPDQIAAAYFQARSPEFRTKFGLLFVALSAQTNSAQKLLAVKAFAPANEEEQEAQDFFVKVYS